MAANENMELRRQVEVVRTNWAGIVLIVILALAVAFGLTYLSDEKYSATARLLVESEDPSSSELATEVQRVVSVPVAELVAEDLAAGDPAGLLSDLQVRPVGDEGSVLAITYTSEDPQYSANAANVFAASYLEYRSQRAAAAAADATVAIEDLIEDTQAELDAVIEQLQSAKGEAAAALESRRAALTLSLGTLQERLADAQLVAAAGEAPGEVLAPASAPSSPSSPNMARNLIFAGLAGLVVGLAIFFIRDRLKETAPAPGIADQGQAAPPPPGPPRPPPPPAPAR